MVKGTVCTNCGEPIKESDIFCMNCGHRLVSNTPQLGSAAQTQQDANPGSASTSENMQFGGSEPEYAPVYVEQSTAKPQTPDPLGGLAVVLSIFGLSFYFTSMMMLYWISLALAIGAIIIGIISLIKKPNRGIGVVGIVLGVVNMALFMSLYLGWF